jgi:hypothetical protein
MAALGTLLYMAPNATQNQAAVVYEYQIVTVFESSHGTDGRIVSIDTAGRPSEVKLDKFFYSTYANDDIVIVDNVQKNVKKITGKINSMSAAGFELYDMHSGIYPLGSSTGQIITRYYFRKPVK